MHKSDIKMTKGNFAQVAEQCIATTLTRIFESKNENLPTGYMEVELSDLPMDSLDLAEVIVSLEVLFEVEISLDDVANIESLSGLARLESLRKQSKT